MAGYVAASMKYGESLGADILNFPEKLSRIKERVTDGLLKLKMQPDVDPKRIGAVGYSFGGYFVTYLATLPEEHGIRAAVLYYGLFDTPKDVSNLRVPVLAFLGDADTNTRIQWSSAMRETDLMHQRKLELVVYRGADHGFDDDSSSGDHAAAEDSWIRMISFLDKHVRAQQPSREP